MILLNTNITSQNPPLSGKLEWDRLQGLVHKSCAMTVSECISLCLSTIKDQTTFATSLHLCYWCPAPDLHSPCLSWVTGLARWLIGLWVSPLTGMYILCLWTSVVINFLIFIYNILSYIILVIFWLPFHMTMVLHYFLQRHRKGNEVL